MKKRMGVLLVVVSVLAPVPALAVETNVYGDPGSGNFSVALQVTADESGNAYVMGTFFGEFQGVQSTGWDLWIARIADDGSFAWVRTWDAPGAEGAFSSLANVREWAWTRSAFELIVDDSGRVRGRVGQLEAALVSVDRDGSNPSYSFINIGIARPALVPDGTGDIMAFMVPDGSPDQVLVRLRADGSLVWASSLTGDYYKPLMVTADGSAVVARQLARLNFQNPAVGIAAVDSSGKVIWETEIYDACLRGSPSGSIGYGGNGSPLIDLGSEVGVVITSPDCGGPDDAVLVPTLNLETGQRVSNRVLSESQSIIWCDDPRIDTARDAAIPAGFVDGDECGGEPVFWTDMNANVISEGSTSEGLSIVGFEIINQGYVGYGIMRSVAEGDRWNPDRLDYVGPSDGFVPWDMAMTKGGIVVVGRVSNTAWITTGSNGYGAAADDSGLGAAALVVLGIHAGRTFLPGGHTIGLVDPTQGAWHLYDNQGAKSFFFGNPGDYPIMGDWNCDGIETPGMYRQSDGYVYLRNQNAQGIADIKFFFGNPGDVPLAGDFDNDGCDTVSIYRPSTQTFYIINKLGTNDGGLGAAEFAYVFGDPGDKPFVGDFNGNGTETVGLHRESTGLVYFRNSHSQGFADSQFIFGDPGDRFVAGDWTGDGVFTPAMFRPTTTTTYFRFTNSQGNADYAFPQGGANWIPVAGKTQP